MNRRTQTMLGVAGLHIIVITALACGTRSRDWVVFACLYPLAAIGVGVAMHRYFAHRSFRTGRLFQFVLALLASLSFGNALHFAGKHQLHHRYADSGRDVHAPRQGWWYCWFGSLLDCGYSDQEIMTQAADWHRYPELRWLYKHSSVPGLLLCGLLFMCGGFSMMAIGGALSPVLLLHQSSAVNYFCHCRGGRRFATRDASTNNALVAMLTYGEGWHNNHHRFPRSARAGLQWWEIDLFYCVICLLEALGLVGDVQRIPDERLRQATYADRTGDPLNVG